MILSLNAPAVQATTDRTRGVEVARRPNDKLAEQCARRGDRFRAFGRAYASRLFYLAQ